MEAFVSSTTTELEPRNDHRAVDESAPPPRPWIRPAARIAFVQFTLAEVEPLPEDNDLAR
jgi:hypothetical protein